MELADTPQTERPRVLIVAENTSALLGGEAILPLHYFRHFVEQGWDIRLITHERNRAALEASFPQLVARTEFSPDTWVHRWIWSVGRFFPGSIRDHFFGNLMGLVTGFQQRRLARKLVAQGHVDLIHQPIPVSPTAPSLLHKMGVPVIMGPMNGGMNYPPGYEDYEPSYARAFVRFGRAMATVVNHYVPGKPRADMLIVANERTRQALPITHPQVIELTENGVDLGLWTFRETPPDRTQALQLVFMGRLIRLKAADFLLHALSLLKQSRPELDVRLSILGDGEERGALEALTHELGLGDQVTFHGFLPQSICVEHLEDADALLLPSLRECGGAVVLEAMATGLPVIAGDWGGPADYLDESCGLLVAPSPRESFAQRLADAIARLADEPELAQALGRAGRQKVEAEYDWTKKIDVMSRLYTQVVAEHRAKRKRG